MTVLIAILCSATTVALFQSIVNRLRSDRPAEVVDSWYRELKIAEELESSIEIASGTEISGTKAALSLAVRHDLNRRLVNRLVPSTPFSTGLLALLGTAATFIGTVSALTIFWSEAFNSVDFVQYIALSVVGIFALGYGIFSNQAVSRSRALLLNRLNPRGTEGALKGERLSRLQKIVISKDVRENVEALLKQIDGEGIERDSENVKDR